MPLLRLLTLAALTLTLTACQAQNRNDAAGPDSTAAGMDHDQMDHDAMGHDMTGSSYSDVRFLDHMTMHHQMALDMARPAVEKASSAEVRTLAQNIIQSQQAEIDSMQAWRARWFPSEPAPGPMSADDMAMMGMGMDMAALEATTGAAFDRMFLQQMIPHHAGAITMAAEAQMRSERPEIRALAETIIAAQAREIGEMQVRVEAMPSGQNRPTAQ